MKRKLYSILILLCLLIAAMASKAELSSNLQIKKEINNKSKKTISETYVDSQGKPVIPSDKGYAVKKYAYNLSNQLKEERYLDTEGNSVNSTDGYACVQYEYKLNKVVKTTYTDANGQLATGPDGYAVQEIVRGIRGIEKEAIEYNTEGQIISRCVTEYVNEANSNLIKSKSWFDAEGKTASGPEGYARVFYEYQKKSKTHIAYYNVDGSLFYNEKDGYAEKEQIYDKGKLKELVYRGADGGLIAGPDGYARATYSNAKNGNEILTMYYNTDGSPFFNKDGYCGIKQYRENGRVVDECYYTDEGVRGACKDGYSRTTKRYTLRGKIAIQCYYDEQDHLISPENIGYAKIKNTYNGRYLIKTEYFDENENPVKSPDGYAVAVHQYAKQLLKETTYYAEDGKTIINSKNGYAKVQYQYNKNKECISEIYYFADDVSKDTYGDVDELHIERNNGQKISESYWKEGQAVNGIKGYHEVRMEYTGKNKIHITSFYGIDGNPVLSTDGYARIEKLYDNNWDVTATLYFNETDELILAPKKEYAYVQIVQTDNNAELSSADTAIDEDSITTVYVEYYDTDRKLMNLSSGYAYIIRQTDAQGRTISEAYYDKDGNRTVLKDGYDEFRQTFARDDKPQKTIYYMNGEPVLLAGGYAVIEREYDEAGNVIMESYYDTAFQPTLCKSGYNKIQREYNEQNKIIYETWFNEKGDKTQSPGNIYYAIKREYDERGLNTVQIYLDNQDRPTPCKNGYEVLSREYNEAKKLSLETYYDHTGQPVRNQIGVYQTAYKYDENGKIILETYQNSNGELIACKEGYAGIERLYDSEGQELAKIYLDAAEKVMTAPGQEYAYMITIPKTEGSEQTLTDTDKYTFYIEYYGTDRQLMNLTTGYAYIVRQTDGQGRITSEAYYDKNNQRVILAKGYDEYRQEFDDNGKPKRIEFYLNEEPVILTDGYAAIERKYDEVGNVVEERYYDTSFQAVSCKNGYEVIRKEYSANKKVRREVYLDHSEQPMTNQKGVYQTAYEYNSIGKVLRESYYNGQGIPMKCQKGFAAVEKLYNDEGKELASICFDESGNIINAPGEEYAYTVTLSGKDDYTQITEYYGIDRQLMNLTAGYAYYIRSKDDQGRIIGEAYYDKDGNKAAVANGYDEYRQAYTDGNKHVRVEYFLNDEPVLLPNGYASIERDYDGLGCVIAERYYDTTNQPTVCKNGYEVIRREYNSDKKVIHEAFFNHMGEPMISNKGVYQIAFEYNKQGKVVREAYYDADGQPMANKSGIIMIEWEYDENGNKISETNYPLEEKQQNE